MNANVQWQVENQLSSLSCLFHSTFSAFKEGKYLHSGCVSPICKMDKLKSNLKHSIKKESVQNVA